MNYDKQILPTKLSTDDYNAFLILTKLEYQSGLIKEESTSELKIYNTSSYSHQVVIMEYII
jgi:hypothetical protein